MAAKKLPDLTTIGELIARHPVAYSDDGCWLWQRQINHNGYGIAYNWGKNNRAHRLAYQLAHGPIPSGTLVCHRCDTRHCVNPDHLFLGDQLANIRDMIRKGRKVVTSGESRPETKLSDAQVTAIFFDQRDRKTIASEYGIHLMYVHRLKRGASRKYLTLKLAGERTPRTDQL